MQYGVGQCLAEYGFAFYENLHQPIFLVHKVGTITKMNRAARKLLKIAHFGCLDLEKSIILEFKNGLKLHQGSYFRMKFPELNIKIIIQILEDSEFAIVEVMR